MLPNLTAIRGGAEYWQVEEDNFIVNALLSCPSSSFRVISDCGIGATFQMGALSFIEGSSSTLEALQVSVAERMDEDLDLSDAPPLSPPVVDFPSLRYIIIQFLFPTGSLPIPLASSRWNLPVLQTLRTNASPSLLPILSLHGSKLRQLGLRSQDSDDHQTYEACFDLCPNLQTFAWQVWESHGQEEEEESDTPVAFNFEKPVFSVQTITIAHGGVRFRGCRVPSRVSLIVPQTVNKTNFPSLRRVSFGSEDAISDA